MTRAASGPVARRSSVLHRYGLLESASNERFDEIVSLAAQLCDTPLASLSFNDRSRECFVACHGLSLDRIPLDKGFGDYVVGGGVPLLISDIRSDIRFPHAPLMKAEPRLRFYAGVPVIAPDGTTLGTLAVMDHTVRHLPEGKLRALAALGSQVVALLGVDQWKGSRANDAGTGNVQPDIQTVFNSVPGVHWLMEPQEFRVVAASEAALEAIGRTRAAVLGLRIEDVVRSEDEDSRASVRRMLASLRRVKKTGRTENLIAQPWMIPGSADGKPRYWTSVNAPVYGPDGKLAYLVHHSEDVTELVQLKEREGRAAKDRRTLEERAEKMEADVLRRSQEMERLNEHLRMAQNVAKVGSWELGMNGDDTRFWSDEIYSILGLKSKDHRPDEDILLAAVHPDDRPLLIAQRSAVVKDSQALEFTHRILRPDGATRHVRQQMRVALDDKGQPVVLYGIVQDITRQKQVESELETRARQQAVVARLGQLALTDASLDELRNEAVKVVAETLDFEYCNDPPLLHDHGVVSGISVLIAGNDGPWGVLGAHTTRLRTFTRDDVNFFESIGHIVAEATHRARITAEMNVRAKQHAALSQLTRRALRGCEARELQALAAEVVPRTLGVEYSKVTEILPDGSGMKVVAGAGWQKGVVGHTVLAIGAGSHGGYVFKSPGPVTFTDVPSESRFRPTQLLFDHGVDSGISVAIRDGDKPLGVLAAHSTQRRWFTEDEKDFVSRAAEILADAMRPR